MASNLDAREFYLDLLNWQEDQMTELAEALESGSELSTTAISIQLRKIMKDTHDKFMNFHRENNE